MADAALTYYMAKYRFNHFGLMLECKYAITHMNDPDIPHDYFDNEIKGAHIDRTMWVIARCILWLAEQQQQQPPLVLSTVTMTDDCKICFEHKEGDSGVNAGCPGENPHLFHYECLKPWLVSGRKECPFCRRTL
jgi:hypothetical protein